MSATATRPAHRVMPTQGFAEPTIEVRGGHPYRGPVEHEGGDRSLYVEDLEGNVVEVWDFFERGEGRREGAAALAGGDVRQDDPSS
jgi:hypothetical protein